MPLGSLSRADTYLVRVLTQAVGGTLKGHRQIAHHRPPSEPADTTGALLLEVPGQDLAPALCSPDFKFVCLFGCAGSLLLRGISLVAAVGG